MKEIKGRIGYLVEEEVALFTILPLVGKQYSRFVIRALLAATAFSVMEGIDDPISKLRCTIPVEERFYWLDKWTLS
jgi:hypothetical protein